VAEFSLIADAFLGGFHKDYGTVVVTEVTDRAIASFALPLGGEAQAEKTIKSVLKLDLPSVGTAAQSEDGATTLLRLGKDQVFCLMDKQPDGHGAHRALSEKLAGTVYTTDQSDVWVSLTIRGPDSLRALERICPIDLHPGSFEVGALARTVMEHLGTVIIRNSDDEYTLMSASSSAKSFLHAIETSIENVL